jgi:catechol 2,3-dioxygenase-like lactoylglutathione lyase family enzyme
VAFDSLPTAVYSGIIELESSSGGPRAAKRENHAYSPAPVSATERATDVFPINGTDYLEFYVGNARQAVHYYQSAFGFQLVGYRGPETGVRDCGRGDGRGLPAGTRSRAVRSRLLDETSPEAFRFDETGAAWHGRRISLDAIADARRCGALGFGSCSFREPVAELTSLELLQAVDS